MKLASIPDFSGDTLISVQAERELGVPARILDLLSAQDRLPRSFSFHDDGDGLSVRLAFAALSQPRCAVMAAKIRRIAGVRRVSESAVLNPAVLQ